MPLTHFLDQSGLQNTKSNQMAVSHKFADAAALEEATKGEIIGFVVENGRDELKEKHKLTSAKAAELHLGVAVVDYELSAGTACLQAQKKCTKQMAVEAYLELCGPFDG